MKKSYFLGLLLLLFGYSFSQTVAVRGTVAAVAEPCLEEPCLPGIVYAIETDSVNYIITLQGLWIWADEPLIIETHTFSINDPISVKGIVSVKQDIYGDDYSEIEIMEVIFESIFDHTISQDDVSIFPSPTAGELRIKNVSIYDIAGRLVLEKNNIDSNEADIDLSNDADGVYFIKVDEKIVKVVKR